MPSDRTSDRRARSTFWIDDAILDVYAPLMARFTFGSAAVAVYCALARRADRDGESWPAIRSIAAQAATSERTAKRALRLLELLGLVEIFSCYEEGSGRQASSRYVLLTPPAVPPDVPDDPEAWPPVLRPVLIIEGKGSRRIVSQHDGASADPMPAGHPTPCRQDTPPMPAGHPPGVSLAPLEGNVSKDTSIKENGAPALLTDERPTTTTTTTDDDDGRRLRPAPSGRAAAPPPTDDADDDGRRAAAPRTTTTTDDDAAPAALTAFDRAHIALLDLAADDPQRPPAMSLTEWARRLTALDPGLLDRLTRKALKERQPCSR